MTQANRAALIGVLLAIPVTILFSLLLLDIEPSLGPLNAWLAGTPNPDDGPGPGSFIALAFIALLPIATFITLRPVGRSIKNGSGLLAQPLNLVLGVAMLAGIIALAGAFVVDQYPCWIGVPYCD